MLTRYEQGSLTWIDLISPTNGEVRQLMEEFGLHPLVAQELLVPSQKSKVDKYEDHIYLVLNFPALRGAHQARAEQEIDFVIGKKFFITARYENINPLHSFARSFESEALMGRTKQNLQGSHLFTSMMKSLYHGLNVECDVLSERLMEIEDRIFSGDERSMVARISHVGRTMHNFKKTLTPHREMLGSMELPGEKLFGREFVYYLHSILGEYNRVERTLENLYLSLVELRETNNSLLSTKQNDIMKTFTVLTFIFLPLSFIAGLFGMNTMNNPIVGNQFDFWIILGVMAVLAIGFYLYFRRKDWL
ncbi:MAG: magnesium transporter CorA family protein [Candidatus Pacebacteria bacterium]|nr:magnesium transporter CorA family protein [Candidatus Paceibacterota bacterium]